MPPPWPSHAGIAGLVVTALLAFVPGCAEEQAPSPALQDPALREGQQLMQQYCGTCHVPAPAASLDRETWLESVLPAMAPKVGIKVLWGDRYYSDQKAAADSALSLREWRKIVAYFEAAAPDSAHAAAGPAVAAQPDPFLFDVRKPHWKGPRAAATGMVAIDAARHRLYSSNVLTETIYRWGEDLEPTRLEAAGGLLGVDARFVEGAAGGRRGVFTSIGTMRAVNATQGAVRAVGLADSSSRVIARGLPRPVCALPGDFNRDGLRDWVVCGFGHDTGGLYLFEQQPDSTFVRKTLRGTPGAVDAQAGDFNGDGWRDVMVLFAHADEGVWLFTNDPNGGFDRENVLRFPPVYGSTSLQLADFNGDGRQDLLYTSGDNADYSSILKPYHGVYLFVNQGAGQYEQAYFYHLDGATEAVTADFDEDGDLDIGAIAFFADIEDRSAQNFVYLEQEAPLAFAPHRPPLQQYGRWISMDAGDVDGDADPDLVLGNYARRYPGQEQRENRTRARLPFIVLENQVR